MSAIPIPVVVINIKSVIHNVLCTVYSLEAKKRKQEGHDGPGSLT